jgi:hypothetical protein
MSLRRLSARAATLATAATVVMTLFAPAARAESSPGDVCDAFPHKQTYTDDGFFRAPVWRYDSTVTIVYEAESCTAEITKDGSYLLTLAGMATVYEGEEPETRPMDMRPFSSVIRSDAKGDGIGWPVKWWNCFEGNFSYVWSIPDVYTFGVTATDGRWLMYQREEPSGESSATAYNACKKGRRAS